jgi:hypothetical protein
VKIIAIKCNHRKIKSLVYGMRVFDLYRASKDAVENKRFLSQ